MPTSGMDLLKRASYHRCVVNPQRLEESHWVVGWVKVQGQPHRRFIAMQIYKQPVRKLPLEVRMASSSSEPYTPDGTLPCAMADNFVAAVNFDAAC